MGPALAGPSVLAPARRIRGPGPRARGAGNLPDRRSACLPQSRRLRVLPDEQVYGNENVKVSAIWRIRPRSRRGILDFPPNLRLPGELALPYNRISTPS